MNPKDDSVDGKIGVRFGCLQRLDDGDEYLQRINRHISDIGKEKEKFISLVEQGALMQESRQGWNGKSTVAMDEYRYTPHSFEIRGDYVTYKDFDKAISIETRKKETIRYKCKCLKCGKIRFVSLETLETKPRFCYRPLFCSGKYTYSVKASNANHRKRQKYARDDSIKLVTDKTNLVPSEEYCNAWNKKRSTEILKDSQKNAEIIAAIPRKYANNYDVDYAGKTYESLDVLECTNDASESEPVAYYTQKHEKKYHNIIVYKEYRCKCYLCGKEMLVTCDRFGIHPPTQYGIRATHGYWSDVFCDCHQISSFQWIVNDILIKNGVDYKVEVAMDDLYGIDNKTPLRFDFAVYREEKVEAFIECQGEQHYKPIKEFGGEYSFSIQQRNDEKKREYAKAHNIKLLEISYKSKKYETVEHILLENGIIQTI